MRHRAHGDHRADGHVPGESWPGSAPGQLRPAQHVGSRTAAPREPARASTPANSRRTCALPAVVTGGQRSTSWPATSHATNGRAPSADDMMQPFDEPLASIPASFDPIAADVIKARGIQPRLGILGHGYPGEDAVESGTVIVLCTTASRLRRRRCVGSKAPSGCLIRTFAVSRSPRRRTRIWRTGAALRVGAVGWRWPGFRRLWLAATAGGRSGQARSARTHPQPVWRWCAGHPPEAEAPR